MPKGVGWCWDSPQEGGFCFPKACAFHNFIDDQGQPVIFAVVGYEAGVNGCDFGQRPTGNDADASMSALSHEHFEMLTDPFLNAWGDAKGQEIADKCNGTFGTPLGRKGARYTQTFNGVNYYVQDEWSNRAAACVNAFPGSSG